jgi:hypothetical protein
MQNRDGNRQSREGNTLFWKAYLEKRGSKPLQSQTRPSTHQHHGPGPVGKELDEGRPGRRRPWRACARGAAAPSPPPGGPSLHVLTMFNEGRTVRGCAGQFWALGRPSTTSFPYIRRGTPPPQHTHTHYTTHLHSSHSLFLPLAQGAPSLPKPHSHLARLD